MNKRLVIDSSGIKFSSFDSTKSSEEKFSTIEYTPYSISLDFRISAKRKGTLLEKALYYSKNKKKRIRNKYKVENIFLKKGAFK